MSNVTSCLPPEPIDSMLEATDDPTTQTENELSTTQPEVAGDPVKEAVTRYSDNHFRLFHHRNDRNIKDDYEKYAGVKPVRTNTCLLKHNGIIR